MPQPSASRRTLRRRHPPTVLHGPDELYQLMAPYVAGLNHEEAFGVYVDPVHTVLAVERLAIGTPSEVAITARDVIGPALRYDAAAYAFCHNHPGGDPTPSDSDADFTLRLARIAYDLDLPLLDHLILGPPRYYSFRQVAVEFEPYNPFGPAVAYRIGPSTDLKGRLRARHDDASETRPGDDMQEPMTTTERQAAFADEDLETRVGYDVTALTHRTVTDPRPRIAGPDDVARLLAPYVADADREHFYGVYLTTKNHVLAVELISVGSLNASLVHPREVLKPAIQYSASAFVVAHNHPSGDPEPSTEDHDFTHRLAQASDLLGIRLFDHVIIGNGDYVSLKARGDMP